MKKRILLIALLALLLCLILAGCKNSPAKLEVQWYAPTPGITVADYLCNLGNDHYTAVATADGNPAQITDVYVVDQLTGQRYPEDSGSAEMVFQANGQYSVIMMVDVGEGKTTDLDHITCTPSNAEILPGDGRYVMFSWEYRMSDLSSEDWEVIIADVYSPDIKEGMTPAEQMKEISVKLISEIYGNDTKCKPENVQWKQKLLNSPWGYVDLDENETFQKGSDYKLTFTVRSDKLNEVPFSYNYVKWYTEGGVWMGNLILEKRGLLRFEIYYRNLTTEPVCYDTEVAIPTPKIGMTPRSENELIDLKATLADEVKYSWSVANTQGKWRDMGDDEIFDTSLSYPNRQYMLTIALPQLADYDEDNSKTIINAERALSVSDPVISFVGQTKTLVLRITYLAADLIAEPNSTNLMVSIGDVAQGDSLQEVADRATVTVNGSPVDITSRYWICISSSNRQTAVDPEKSPTFGTNSGPDTFGSTFPIRYYGLMLYLRYSQAVAEENVGDICVDGSPVVQGATELVSYDENTTKVVVWLDVNRMQSTYEYTGAKSMVMLLPQPEYGKTVKDWLTDERIYAYTDTRVYFIGDEFELTASVITKNGEKQLNDNDILTRDNDIIMYVVHARLLNTGLPEGTIINGTVYGVYGENNFYEISDVLADGEIQITAGFIPDKCTSCFYEYNAYDVSAGMTVAAAVANAPETITDFDSNFRVYKILSVKKVTYREADDFNPENAKGVNERTMGEDDHFIAGKKYCMDVEISSYEDFYFQSQPVRSLVGNFTATCSGTFSTWDYKPMLHLMFECAADGDCQHSFSYTIGKAPTCTANGEYLVTCEYCGYSYTTVAEATGHNMVKTEEKKGSCTTEGYVLYTCKNCGEKSKVTTPAAGHSLDWTYDNNYHWLACSKCGFVPADCEKGYHRPTGDGVEVQLNGHGYYEYRCRTCYSYYYELIVN